MSQKITPRKNEKSGLMEFNLNVKVVSKSATVYQLDNEKKTPFHYCSVQLPNGNIRTGRIWAKSFDRITEGQEYQALITALPPRDGKSVYMIDVAPFLGGQVATEDDFAGMLEAIPATTKANVVA